MSGINKAIIVGRLGADPDMRFLDSGDAVCSFPVATSDQWTARDGEKKEKTEWHKIVCWKKLAENCREYLTKGRMVYVEGKIQTRKWQDKDGNDRYTTEIQARDVQFLGSKNDNALKEQDKSASEPEQDNISF